MLSSLRQDPIREESLPERKKRRKEKKKREEFAAWRAWPRAYLIGSFEYNLRHKSQVHVTLFN